MAGWLEGPTGRVEQVRARGYDHDHDDHDDDHDYLFGLGLSSVYRFHNVEFFWGGRGGGGVNISKSMIEIERW